MGSIVRILGLAGVISAGTFMLYQAETRISDQESLTEAESAEHAPVSLGDAAGDQSASFDLSELTQEEPDSPLAPVEDDPELEPVPRFASSDLNEDDSRVTTAEARRDADDPFATIQPASNEQPFVADDDPPNMSDRASATPGNARDPFDSNPFDADPFGDAPATAPQKSEPADPFGEFPSREPSEIPATKKPEPPPALNLDLPDEFPDLETKTPDPFEESATDSPKPARELDPFPAFPEEPGPDRAPPRELPAETSDPFSDSTPSQPAPRAAEPDPFTASPASNNPPRLSEPGPFSEPEMFEQVEPKRQPELGQTGPIITPLRPSSSRNEPQPPADFELPKITPKPKNSPVSNAPPRATDSARSVPTVESDPFESSPVRPGVSPASAEQAFPLTPPKSKEEEIDPFAEDLRDREPFREPKTPEAFPGLDDLKPAPAPTQLEDAFPGQDPSPAAPFAAPDTSTKPIPAEDAFPELNVGPANSKPPAENAVEERAVPALPDVEPIDDSYHFPPLPRAIPGTAPAPKTTPGEEFPDLDSFEQGPAIGSPTTPPEASPVNPLPNLDDLAVEPRDKPDPAFEPLPSNDFRPEAPKELRDSGISRPIEPRSVPLPQLVIEKQAPDKAVLHQPFVYHILVKNTGQTAVSQVTVQDQVPRGTKLTGTIPQAELAGERLTWKLDRMNPGEEKKISIRVIPEQPGPIGSVATVNFVTEVGSETLIEQPKLDFRMTLPTEARVGEVVTCRFDIQNQGDQTITGLVLRALIPEGLYHPAGQDLENPLGDVKPGERIIEKLQLKVTRPGEIANRAYLGAEGGLRLETSARLMAQPNRLTITRRGPKQRIVGRTAIYHNLIKNISDQPVRDAMVIEQLPPGMEFVSANEEGEFHAKGRTIFWKIPVLEPGRTLVLQSKVIPHEEGTQESLVRVVESGTQAEPRRSEIQAISHTKVEPAEALGIVMTELGQPILVGDTVLMTIEATNRGERAAENVRIRAAIPPSLHLMNVRGETRFRIEGREVVFEPLNQLTPGKREFIQLELKAAAASNANVSVSIQSNKMPQPLEKMSALAVQKAVR
jgi:uncharacterized repeat protein (TIGR01451 family)